MAKKANDWERDDEGPNPQGPQAADGNARKRAHAAARFRRKRLLEVLGDAM